MHRQILENCWPLALWLLAGVACLALLVRLSQARLDWSRLRRLPRCQEGSVQTLSFVFTMPAFIMIVLFILQVSQLMVGIAVVHYAAFAAARAAIVWIPAEVDGYSGAEPQNVVSVKNSDAIEYSLPVLSGEGDTISRSTKCRRIWAAAVQACAPIAPSRPLYTPRQAVITEMADKLAAAYRTLDPTADRNSKIPVRIQNKLAYSAMHTTVLIEGLYRDRDTGFKYGTPIYGEIDDRVYIVDVITPPDELGWEDPLTVTVRHRFALLPGPGRLLAKYIVPADGSTDRVSDRIRLFTAEQGSPPERIYTTVLGASLTLSNEGLKSVMPYVQTVD